MFCVILIPSGKLLSITCPPNFTAKTDTLTIGGCDYVIDLCFKCATINDSNEVILKKYRKIYRNCTESPAMTEQQVFDEIINQITQAYYIRYELCNCNVPPCNEGGLTFYFYSNVCWYKYYDSEFNTAIVEQCGNAYCLKKYRLCWTELEGEHTELMSSTPCGNWNSCDYSEIPDDPGPNDPPTDCYRYVTDCQ